MDETDDLPGRRGYVSAAQVALRAGVSRSAVSRTFTPGASVSPETRAKVTEAAEALGYHVNDLARGLLANRSRLVGLVATNPEEGFRALLVAALTRALIRRGSVPVLINTGRTEAEMAAAQRILLGHRAEAVIILSGKPHGDFVEIARRNDQPVVMIGRSEPGVDQVRVDNAGAARQIARAFAKAGARRLGLANSRLGTPSMAEREAAFCDEAGRLGLPVAIGRGEDSVYAGGVAAAVELFGTAARPDAVFCANDQIAFGLIDHLRGLGLTMPGDVAVVGFDDVPEAAWSSFALTTFRQDPDRLAAEAIALIEARQADPDAAVARTDVSPRLIIRQTFTPANFS
ncbi:MAG: LacI family DNA-binding transcriptional regulator [Rhodobacteraceae bacterium]|nr:LacI family DNA-binding transcriptional regulator [Paracoccaceae bacterium]